MDRWTFRGCLAWLALAGAGVAQSPGEQAPWTEEQLAADLDEIAVAVRSRWSYLDDRRENFGVDLDGLIAEAKAELPSVEDAEDWARVLRRLAAGLQDGHAIVRVPGVRSVPSRRLPLRVEPCAEGLVVTAVAGDVDARRGDLLVAVDGAPIERVIAELEREAIGSTPGMRRRLAIDRLHRLDAEKLTMTFEGPDGERRRIAVRTLARTDPVPLSRSHVENWSLSWPREDVAVLHLRSFTVPRWREWLEAEPEEREPFLVEALGRIEAVVEELNARPAEALVIDLRGNTGGTDRLGIHLAERLLEDRFRYFLLSARLDDGSWNRPGGLVYGKGDHARFSGSVVLVVDETSFSTTDNFARCLTDLHPDITVVGRPTGGGTGAPRVLVETTHTKASFGACTQRVRGPKGRLIEGRGTVPDIRVEWTREDWMTGRDPDLEAALRHLEEGK